MDELSREESELIEAARAIMAARFAQDRHHVAAALRTRSRQVFSAVHLEATVGRIGVCAEAVAIGMAAAAGEASVDTIVAVDRTGAVVSPCGMCRELICDYGPEARVIVPSANGPEVVPVRELLPNKYRSSWRAR